METMTDAMQTIRDALEMAKEHIPAMTPAMTPDMDDIEAAISALDSLAVTPSEDARAFLESTMRVADNWVISPESLEESHVKAAALIQARDERIRRETLQECPYKKTKRFYCKDGNSTIAICTKPEATDGQ